MGMSQHDGVGMQVLEFSQPIQSAIEHHIGAAIRHEQGSVHAMPPCSRRDFSAGAEKDEFH